MNAILSINYRLIFWFNFLNKYLNVLKTHCENCNCEILDIDTVCLNCGFFIKNIACTILPSHRKHNPSKHCEKWLLQLQGKDFIPCEESQMILSTAQDDYNKRNGIIVFNCELIRSYLKNLDSPNITLIFHTFVNTLIVI